MLDDFCTQMRCNEFIDIFFTNLNQVLDGDGDTRYQTGTIGICWGVGVGVRELACIEILMVNMEELMMK